MNLFFGLHRRQGSRIDRSSVQDRAFAIRKSKADRQYKHDVELSGTQEPVVFSNLYKLIKELLFTGRGVVITCYVNVFLRLVHLVRASTSELNVYFQMKSVQLPPHLLLLPRRQDPTLGCQRYSKMALKMESSMRSLLYIPDPLAGHD